MSDRTPFHEQVRAALDEDRPSTGGSGSSRTSGADRSARGSGDTRVDTPTARTKSARPSTKGRPPGKSAASRGSTRTARLRMIRLDPWSVMKTAFLLSIALGVVTVVSVAIVWGVLGAAGVWDSINNSIAQVVGESGTSFDIEDYLGTSRVLGFTVLVAVADVILLTAIATLGAFLYNLAAALLGGLEVTFAEDDR